MKQQKPLLTTIGLLLVVMIALLLILIINIINNLNQIQNNIDIIKTFILLND